MTITGTLRNKKNVIGNFGYIYEFMIPLDCIELGRVLDPPPQMLTLFTKKLLFSTYFDHLSNHLPVVAF